MIAKVFTHDKQATGARASVAYDRLIGAQVASGAVRYEPGPWPGYQAALVEEGTTNLLPVGAEDFATAHGWTARDGASITVTPGQPDPWGGTTAYRIQSSGGTNAVKYQCAVLGRPDPHTDTGSIWIKVLSGNARFGLSRLQVNASASWQRLSDCIVDFASTNSTLYLGCTNAADSLDILVCLPQIEQKPYATSWHLPGTPRAPESLSVPLAGLTPAVGTWEQWVYIDANARRQVSGQYPRIFDIPRSIGGWGLAVWHAPEAGHWRLAARNDAGTQVSASASDSYTPDGWHLFKVIWMPTAAKLYIDNALRATLNNPPLPSGFGATGYIGSEGGTGNFLNTLHACVRLSNIDRSGETVDLTRPLPTDAGTVYKYSLSGLLDNEIEIPLVYAQAINWRRFGGAPGRTADGSARGRYYARRRAWKLKTRPILKADADILIDYLRSHPWAQWFWLDELGPDTNRIKAYIDIDKVEPVQAASRRLALELTVSEQG